MNKKTVKKKVTKKKCPGCDGKLREWRPGNLVCTECGYDDSAPIEYSLRWAKQFGGPHEGCS